MAKWSNTLPGNKPSFVSPSLTSPSVEGHSSTLSIAFNTHIFMRTETKIRGCWEVSFRAILLPKVSYCLMNFLIVAGSQFRASGSQSSYILHPKYMSE